MLSNYLIICPLVFIAGFIDAVAGGGGLVSLPAYIFTGIPVHQCVATNKMSALIGSALGASGFEKNGSKLVRPVMLLVLSIFLIKLFFEVFSEKLF